MTRMLDRKLTTRIESQKSHVLLLGPRQVGKSTLVKNLGPELFIDLADQSNFLAYARDPSRIVREVRALRKPCLIAIDEVQRIPSLLNSVQSLIDENPFGHRFILTGSSARKLKHGEANLLPGRIIVEHLGAFTVSELGNEFDLDRALQVGMLPGVYLNNREGEKLLKAYANTYLREEIQAEGLAQNIGAFSRLLDAVAIVSGQWLNYSELASDTEIPKETLRRYISVLEDTLVLHRLGPFKPRLKLSRKISQKEKVILFDLGVRNALLGLSGQIPSPDQRGNLFEQFFVLQVLALSQSEGKDWRISSFLTRSKQEVDLVIETPKKVIGIEIKSGKTLHARRFPGLTALSDVVQSYKPIEKWVVFTGERIQQLEDAVQAIPFISALKILEEE